MLARARAPKLQKAPQKRQEHNGMHDIPVTPAKADSHPTHGDAPSKERPAAVRSSFDTYQQLVSRLQRVAAACIPPDATVLVVSKGDEALLTLNAARAWHFPRTAEGVYAGSYPSDSAAAIAHLEELREKGADFLVIPQTSFWWLDHYADLRRHLESNYPTLLRADDTCAIFSLRRGADKPAAGAPATPIATTTDSSDNDLRAVFDLEFYSQQAGTFTTLEEAIAHYVQTGFTRGYSPHPLFDPVYYSKEHLPSRKSGLCPLLHFLRHSACELQNPNPYFDTEFYYIQQPSLRTAGINALVHYVKHANEGKASRPNPLFGSMFYLDYYPDAKHSGIDPFTHFLRTGISGGRFASQMHKSITTAVLRPSKAHLLRGNWHQGSILMFAEGRTESEVQMMLRLSQAAQAEYHLKCPLLIRMRPEQLPSDLDQSHVVFLQEVLAACEIFRPSALRLLARCLVQSNPLFAASSDPLMIQHLRAEGVSTFYLSDDESSQRSKPDLEQAFESATRVLFQSSLAFQAASQELGRHPTHVALRVFDEKRPEAYLHSLLDLVKRDLKLPQNLLPVAQIRQAPDTKKVYIPCSDWGVSGVNSTLEAIGKELIARGWKVEILFTRDPESNPSKLAAGPHLPEIPYRQIRSATAAIEDRWEALIAHLEANAPCMMLTAYDFIGNSVISALTDKVGAVAWVQSDDGDYYEQIYRLGRYCNAIVCVSDHIRKKTEDLNPRFSERTYLIHNSSICEADIATKKSMDRKRLRIVYTGRLVYYQKRLLDFVELASALDELQVPYRISLVGDFPGHEKIGRESVEAVFRRRASAYLRNGRIELLGRVKHNHALEVLSENDFFLLLSDFEGLPLSLIEAMARGCVPVVAAMESGVPEIVQDQQNGIVISGRDYRQWARTLVQLWRDPKRARELSERARQTVREHFTTERTGLQFTDILSRVAQEICSGKYHRPQALTWGVGRSPTGDILPPPSWTRTLPLN
jgi:glycosyltransferase involved in cell wall biosynthesis